MVSYLKVIFSLLFVGFMFVGCVDTDSSSRTSTVDTDNNTSVGDDTNTTTGDDNNTSDGDDNYDDIEPNADQENSDYDTRGAILDPNACRITDIYSETLLHSSFAPGRESDVENGIEIGSRYPHSTNIELTRVALFYPRLIQSPIERSVSISKPTYVLSFDQSWVGNAEKRVYVRTPKVAENNGYFGCFRYDLNSVTAAEIEAVKVYRLR